MSQTSGLELSQDVLYGIAQLALDTVKGVRPITPPTRVGEFLTGRRAKGIHITREDDRVDVSLTVAVTYGERIPQVAKEVQRAVREAVGSMTGLTVRTVEVFIEAVDVPPALASTRRRRAPAPAKAKAKGAAKRAKPEAKPAAPPKAERPAASKTGEAGSATGGSEDDRRG